MNIRNPKSYMDSVWDWSFLNDCFGGKIRVSDMDGYVERHGRLLMFETKRPGVPIPQGQEITCLNLAKRDDVAIVIWGEQNKPESAKLYSRLNPEGAYYESIDEQWLQEMSKAFYRQSSGIFLPK